MTRAWLIAPLLIAACARAPISDADTAGQDTSGSSGASGSSSGADDGSSSGAATESTTTDGSTESSGDGADTGECWVEPEPCAFIPCPDLGIEPEQCDPYAQDCGPGEKCALVDSSILCAVVLPNPAQLGEPCTIAQWGSGQPDDCDVGLVCRAVPWFALNPEGADPICHPICQGSADDPICPDGMFCEDESIPACFSTSECQP